MTRRYLGFWTVGLLLVSSVAYAQEPPIVGLIPRAQKPIQMDGKLDDWQGAFVTPVHIGHPDFANRGAEFLFLWDDENLYIGLRCLDQKPAHIAPDTQIYNGDAVEFYLDTRQGQDLGAAAFGPGTLHMFWTPFTGTQVKPRLQVRDLPAFKNFKLQGAKVAAVKTAVGYTAEFKLPWANFPKFTPKADTIIGIDCELCSSDGGLRVDRTFVYSSPRSVTTPAAFGQVKLVERIDPAKLQPYSRALLPLSITQSANYPWMYGTAGVSPTIAGSVAKIEGRVLDAAGKVKLKTPGKMTTTTVITLWTGTWELFEQPPGQYTLEVRALDRDGRVVCSRSMPFVHERSAGK
jgi:hypothetical protein